MTDVKEEEVLVEEEIPAADDSPGLKQRHNKKLSLTSKNYDIGNKGYLDDVEKKLRSYDTDNDGKIDVKEAYQIVKDVQKEEQGKVAAEASNALFKKLLCYSSTVSVVLAACMIGMVFVALALSKDTKTSDDSYLLDKKTDQVVVTAAEGFNVPFTPAVDNSSLVLSDEVTENLVHVGNVPCSMVWGAFDGVLSTATSVRASTTTPDSEESWKVDTNKVYEYSLGDYYHFSDIHLEDANVNTTFEVLCPSKTCDANQKCDVYRFPEQVDDLEEQDRFRLLMGRSGRELVSSALNDGLSFVPSVLTFMFCCTVLDVVFAKWGKHTGCEFLFMV